MNKLSKSIWSGRYGVIGFDKDGTAIVGKKVLTPAEQAERAAERFRARILRSVLSEDDERTLEHREAAEG